MKSYSQYQDEITPEQLYEGLLVHGMFTEKLPPIFSMESFWKFVKENGQTFNGGNHDYVYFEAMRNNGIPRAYGIPVPMAYERLCACLKDNWINIRNHFHNQTDNQIYKISRIHLRKIKNSQKLFEMNYNKWWIDPDPTIDLLLGKKYVVKSDISTCFPSIYTHSIPWALIGKDNAKADRRKSQWFNKIDKLCCATKSGETHGLLIGPHSSNLISEIILTVVDKKISESGFSFVRNIDDYECFVETYERGQEFLTCLNSELREFDLPLNRKKTSILPLPNAIVEKWINRLTDAITLQIGGSIKRKQIKTFLDTVLLLMNEAEDAAVLKYAMKVLAGCKADFDDAAREYYVKIILHLAAIFPYTIQSLDEYVFEAFMVEKETIKDFVDKIFMDSVQLQNFEAIYYAIFFSLKYDFVIDGVDVDSAIKSNDCLYKLFVFLYFKRNNNSEALKLLKNNAIDLKKRSTGNMDRYWIFCYEALSEGQLNDEWKLLKQEKVSFLRPEYRC